MSVLSTVEEGNFNGLLNLINEQIDSMDFLLDQEGVVVVRPNPNRTRSQAGTSRNNGATSANSTTLGLSRVNVNLAPDSRTVLNPEEEIIRQRGRRQIPRTPTRKSPRKRTHSAVLESDSPPLLQHCMVSTGTPTEVHKNQDCAQRGFKHPTAEIEASPFTKCLRAIQSPPRPLVLNDRVLSLRKRLCQSPDSSTVDDFNNSTLSTKSTRSSTCSNVSSSSSSLSSSFKIQQSYYYSPISRKLRSSDHLDLDDSGVGDLSSSLSLARDSVGSSKDNEDTMSVKSASSTKSKSGNSSVNKARRRLRL